MPELEQMMKASCTDVELEQVQVLFSGLRSVVSLQPS